MNRYVYDEKSFDETEMLSNIISFGPLDHLPGGGDPGPDGPVPEGVAAGPGHLRPRAERGEVDLLLLLLLLDDDHGLGGLLLRPGLVPVDPDPRGGCHLGPDGLRVHPGAHQLLLVELQVAVVLGALGDLTDGQRIRSRI